MKRLRHPIRAIREPLGTAGLIVAMVALVAALGGSALAAKGAPKGALTGKQKKEVEKIAKKFAGKNGANGANGKDGAPGPAGPPGPSTGAAGGVLTGSYPSPGLADGSVTTSSFAAGAIAPNAALFGGFLPSAWQKRVTGTCAAGNAIREVKADGTVTCQAAGSGTVTSVGSGTGLTGGPITGSGSLAVDPTIVQSRVSNTCSVGQAITAIAQNGTATCAATMPTSLPTGSTETGSWYAKSDSSAPAGSDLYGGKAEMAISFPIPLAAALASNKVKFNPIPGAAKGASNGTLTSGSRVVTGTSPGWQPGTAIAGEGVPSGAYIAKWISNSEFELSAAATESGTKSLTGTARPADAECEDPSHTGTAGPENPEAKSGFLCIYAAHAGPIGGTNPTPGMLGTLTIEAPAGISKTHKSGAASGEFLSHLGVSTAGAILPFRDGGIEQPIWGTFAVGG